MCTESRNVNIPPTPTKPTNPINVQATKCYQMLKTNDSMKRSGKICDPANFQQLWGSNSAAQAFFAGLHCHHQKALQIVCIPITSECCSSTRARIRPPANARAVVLHTLCKTSRAQSLKTGFTHIHTSKMSKVGFQSL